MAFMLRVKFKGHGRYRLLEISDPRLINGNLQVKGEEGEEAILISPSIGCFKLREACISNQLLWVEGNECRLMATGYLEAVACRGRTERLKPLFEQYALRDPHDHACPIIWETILEYTQASNEEILRALRHLNAFEWFGGWRILAREYLVELCGMILRESIHTENAEIQAIVGKLTTQEISKILLEDELIACPNVFWKPFQLKWTQKYAQLAPLTVESLTCVAWLEEHAASNDHRVRYLPSHSLPMDLPGRLTRLFRERPRWPESELMAYLGDGHEAEVLPFFLKNCRVMTDSQGQKWVTPMIPL